MTIEAKKEVLEAYFENREDILSVLGINPGEEPSFIKGNGDEIYIYNPEVRKKDPSVIVATKFNDKLKSVELLYGTVIVSAVDFIKGGFRSLVDEDIYKIKKSIA